MMSGAPRRICWLSTEGEASEPWEYSAYTPNNRPAAYVFAHHEAPPADALGATPLDELAAAHARSLGHTVAALPAPSPPLEERALDDGDDDDDEAEAPSFLSVHGRGNDDDDDAVSSGSYDDDEFLVATPSPPLPPPTAPVTMTTPTTTAKATFVSWDEMIASPVLAHVAKRLVQSPRPAPVQPQPQPQPQPPPPQQQPPPPPPQSQRPPPPPLTDDDLLAFLTVHRLQQHHEPLARVRLTPARLKVLAVDGATKFATALSGIGIALGDACDIFDALIKSASPRAAVAATQSPPRSPGRAAVTPSPPRSPGRVVPPPSPPQAAAAPPAAPLPLSDSALRISKVASDVSVLTDDGNGDDEDESTEERDQADDSDAEPAPPVKSLSSSTRRLMLHGRVEEGRVDGSDMGSSVRLVDPAAAASAPPPPPPVDDDDDELAAPPPEPALSDDVVSRLLEPPPLPLSFAAPPLPADSDVGTLPLLTPRAKNLIAVTAFLAQTDSASSTAIRTHTDESESDDSQPLTDIGSTPSFESLFAPEEPELPTTPQPQPTQSLQQSQRRAGSAVQSKSTRTKRTPSIAVSPTGSPQPTSSSSAVPLRRTVSSTPTVSLITGSPTARSRRRRDSVAKMGPVNPTAAASASTTAASGATPTTTRRRRDSEVNAARYIALQPPRAEPSAASKSLADGLTAEGMVCVPSVRSCIAVTTVKPKPLIELLEQALAARPGVEFARVNPLAVRAVDTNDAVRVEFAIVTVGRRGQLFGIACRRVQGEPFHYKKTIQAIVGSMHLETKVNGASIDHALASEVGAVAAAATGVGAHRIDLTRLADSSIDSDVSIQEQLREMRANEALLVQQVAVMDKKMATKLTKPERKRMEALLANLKVDLQDVRSKLQGLEVVATGDLAAIAVALSEASERRARLELQLQEASAVLANVKTKKADRQRVEETLPALNASLDVVRARIELLEVARTRLSNRNAPSPVSPSNAVISGTILPKRRRHRRSGVNGAADADSEDSETNK